MFAIFGGLFHWWPKAFGRMLDERLGKIQFWTIALGFNLTFFPMHILGLQGQPRRTYTYAEGMGWDFMNMLVTIGAFIIATGMLVFVANVLLTWRRGEQAPDDPWDARTLEWMTSSPPPEYNFAEIPEITQRDEWWHRKYTEDDEGRPVARADAPSVERPAADPDSIHMPSPSYWPMVLALGMPVLGYGLVFKSWWILVGGVSVMLFGMYGWIVEAPTEEA